MSTRRTATCIRIVGLGWACGGAAAALAFRHHLPLHAPSARDGLYGFATFYRYPMSYEVELLALGIALMVGAGIVGTELVRRLARRATAGKQFITRAALTATIFPLAWSGLPDLASTDVISVWLVHGLLLAVAWHAPPGRPYAIPRRATAVFVMAALGLGFAGWSVALHAGLAYPGRVFRTVVLAYVGLAALRVRRDRAQGLAELAVADTPFMFAPLVVIAGERWAGLYAALTLVLILLVVGGLRGATSPPSTRQPIRLWPLASALALWAALLHLSGAHFVIGIFDRDLVLGWTYELLRGAVPFRDFWFPYGFDIYLRGAFTWLSGAGGGMTVAWMWTSAVGILATFLVARRLQGTALAALMTSLGALAISVLTELGGVSMTARQGFGLLAIAWSWDALFGPVRDARWRGVLGGAALGAALMYSFDVGLYALPGTGVLVFGHLVMRRFRPVRWAALGAIGLATACTAGGVLAGYAWCGALPGYLSTLVNMLGPGPAMTKLAFPELARGLPTAPDALARFALLVSAPALGFAAVGLYGATIIIAFQRWRDDRMNSRGWLAASLALFGLALFRTATGRTETPHIGYALLPAYLLLAYGCHRVGRGLRVRLGRHPPGASELRAAGTAGGLVAASVLAILFRPQVTYLAQLAADLSSVSPPPSSTVFASAVGPLYAPPELADEYRSVVEFLRPRLPSSPDQHELFAFPMIPIFYPLLGQRSPTRFTAWWDVRTRAEERAIIQILRTRRPRYFVFDTTQLEMDWVPWAYRTPRVWRYAMAHGQLEKRAGRFAVLRHVAQPVHLPLACRGSACGAPTWEVQSQRVHTSQLLPPGRYRLDLHLGSSAGSYVVRAGSDVATPIPLHPQGGRPGHLSAVFQLDTLSEGLIIEGTNLAATNLRWLCLRRPIRRQRIDFDRDGDAIVINPYGMPSVANGNLTVTSSSAGLTVTVPIDGDVQLTRLDLRMRVSGGTFGQVAIQTEAHPGWTLVRRFPLARHRRFATYRVPLDGWYDGSPARAVRLEPTSAAGNTVVLDWVRLRGNGFAAPRGATAP